MLQSVARARTLFILLLTAPFCPTLLAVELWEFTGDMCSACRQMDPTVAQVRAMGVPVRQVNVDHQPDLANRFDVRQIPCFVVVADHGPVDRITGIASAQQLLDMFHRARNAIAPTVIRGQSPPTQPYAPVPVSPAAATVVPNSTSSNSYSPAELLALAATVRIKVIDDKGHSYGTGTIIHCQGPEALVLTCGHIFRDSNGTGEIRCDVVVDQQHREIPARLISYNLRRDVGLISLQPGGTVQPVRVGGTGTRQQTGDSVYAIGCSHGQSPTIIRNQVRAVNRYHGPANLVVGGRPVDGRSGGGLFDRNGTLIGVCNAADQREDEGLYAALGPIHAELDESGFSFAYRTSTAQLTPLANSLASTNPTPLTLPQQAVSPGVVSPGVPGVPSPGVSPLPQQAVSPVETAQIAQTAQSPEIIVILRGRGSQGQEGQAYVLDHPSDGLMHAISGELARRGAHATTQLQISNATEPWQPLRR